MKGDKADPDEQDPVRLTPDGSQSLEDVDVSYLYVKDNTRDLTGFAADESLSDKAKSAGNGSFESGPRIEGLGDCYVQVADALDMRTASARRTIKIDGERVSFTYREAINGETHQHESAPCECFAYLVSGAFDCRIDNDARSLGPGDILHVSKQASFSLTVTGAPARGSCSSRPQCSSGWSTINSLPVWPETSAIDESLFAVS